MGIGQSPTAFAGADMTLRNTTTLLFFVLYLGATGAGIGEGFQYDSWRFIPPEAFAIVHSTVGSVAQHWLVPFVLLGFVTSIVTIWLHHPAMSRLLIVLATALYAESFIITAIKVIPLQVKIEHALSIPALDQLIYFHFYFRVLPGLAGIIIIAVLLSQVLRAAPQPNPALT